MPVLELTDEQVIKLLQQLPEEQKQRVLMGLQASMASRPVPQFGIAKGAIRYMAPNFDAPLDDFKEYME